MSALKFNQKENTFTRENFIISSKLDQQITIKKSAKQPPTITACYFKYV